MRVASEFCVLLYIDLGKVAVALVKSENNVIFSRRIQLRFFFTESNITGKRFFSLVAYCFVAVFTHDSASRLRTMHSPTNSAYYVTRMVKNSC